MAARQVRPVTWGKPNCRTRWSRRPEKLPALNPRIVTVPTEAEDGSPASPSKDKAATGQRQESVRQIGSGGGGGTAAKAAGSQRRLDPSGEGSTRVARVGEDTMTLLPSITTRSSHQHGRRSQPKSRFFFCAGDFRSSRLDIQHPSCQIAIVHDKSGKL